MFSVLEAKLLLTYRRLRNNEWRPKRTVSSFLQGSSVFSRIKKGTQARNKRIKISIALEENEKDEKMTDGQEISFKDIRKGHRHAVSKCQRGEEWRRWAAVQRDLYHMASRSLPDTVSALGFICCFTALQVYCFNSCYPQKEQAGVSSVKANLTCLCHRTRSSYNSADKFLFIKDAREQQMLFLVKCVILLKLFRQHWTSGFDWLFESQHL